MRIHLINLDRSPERLAEFQRLNGHLTDVARFSAIDGAQVDRGALVGRQIIAPDLDYTDGALGNCLSHLALWDRATADQAPVTLCEDDAIFNRWFERDAAALIARLGRDWDIVFWGWNFDAVAVFELIPGVSPFVAHFDQDQLRGGIAMFQAANVMPRAFRLIAAFGIMCYSISPAGAQRLRELCLPLRGASVTLPMVGRSFANKDLSVALLDALPKVRAFASFPPLSVTRNDHAVSTVLAPADSSPPNGLA